MYIYTQLHVWIEQCQLTAARRDGVLMGPSRRAYVRALTLGTSGLLLTVAAIGMLARQMPPRRRNVDVLSTKLRAQVLTPEDDKLANTVAVSLLENSASSSDAQIDSHITGWLHKVHAAAQLPSKAARMQMLMLKPSSMFATQRGPFGS